MTQAIVKAAPQAVAEWSSDEEKVLRATVAPDLSPPEFALFSRVCAHSGLDPFKREIYAIKRGGKMTIQTGIDGYRLIALRSGRYGGSESFWCGEDGIWRDVWLEDSPPSAAKTIVTTKDGGEYVGIATWREYCQKDRDGRPTDMWKRMSSNQLAKCSEALALRKACPGEFEGIYVDAEMDQAANREPSTDRQPSRGSARQERIEAGREALKQAQQPPPWLVEIRAQVAEGWDGKMADFADMLGGATTLGAWKAWGIQQEDPYAVAVEWYRANKLTPAEQAMEAGADTVDGEFTDLATAALDLPFE